VLYVDTSALLKRYIAEQDSDACERHLLADPVWVTGRARSLDALHIAAAMRVGGPLTFITYDVRQAVAARQLGLVVNGA